MSKTFVGWILEYSVEGMDDLKEMIQRLQTWGKFESAAKLQAWLDKFNLCVKDEWDEETSYQPIPVLPPYFDGDFDIDMNGWYHAWELPDGYEPQDTYSDDGL